MVSNVKSFKNSILKLDIFQAYHLLHRYILFNARTKKIRGRHRVCHINCSFQINGNQVCLLGIIAF